MLIRSLMQAVYQPKNLGHFGLGFPAYTHFTSPIRRYPDLLVHRGIRHLIRNSNNPHVEKQKNAAPLAKKDIYPYQLTDLVTLGETCSMAERRADAASYSVLDWLKCEYMQDKIGEEFPGTVSSVTGFGLFVELNEIFVEGLVPVSELNNDYYRFDPVRHCLEGERSKQRYSLGDVVQVKVVRVDLDEKKIDLVLAGSSATIATNRGGQNKKGSKGRSKESGSLRERLRAGDKSVTGESKSGSSKDKNKKQGKNPKKARGANTGKSGSSSAKSPVGAEASKKSKPKRKRKPQGRARAAAKPGKR